MTRSGGETVRRAVHSAAITAGATDRELLTRFATGDAAAFAVLVKRHTGLVLGVCRRALPTVQDAEDACQAVFLILAKKADQGRWQPSVANWLYTTARRVASSARRDAARRARLKPRVVLAAAESPLDQLTGREAFAALDEELDRLPGIYRAPLVLCYLEGLTRDEAAARLGVPAATLKSQLDRGRKKLGDALSRRGVGLGAGLLAVAATSVARASPAHLTTAILAGVGGPPPAAVAALAKRSSMSGLTTTKFAVLAAAGLALWGVGYASTGAEGGAGRPTTREVEAPGAKAAPPAANPRVTAPKPAAAERTITGRVLGSDGKPIVADLHLIWPAGSGQAHLTWVEGRSEAAGKTNADGSFRVTVPLRRFGWQNVLTGPALVATAAGHGLDFVKPAADTPADVTLRLPKDLPIRGRVIDTQGKPVAGAVVRLGLVAAGPGDSLQPVLDAWKKRSSFRDEPQLDRWLSSGACLPFGTTTDAAGRFELTGAGADRLVSVTIRSPGRAFAEVHVVTRAGFDPKPYNDVTLGLRPTTGEQLSWSFNPILSAPDLTVAVEVEKPVRGTLTDARTGQPRRGVEVTLRQDDGLQRHHFKATTDAQGKYEFRGAKKWPTYTVATKTDHQAGYLPCSVEGKDTSGYEPVVVDVPGPKGVIVTGTLRDKSTGQPIPGFVEANVLTGNPFLKNYPHIFQRRAPTLERAYPGSDGEYRLVIIPGPVLLAGGSNPEENGGPDVYRAPKPDPRFPQYFHTQFNTLGYDAPGGAMGGINGNWCKVIEGRETDTILTQDIELEPAPRRAVKVVDRDGKPIAGVHATGTTHFEWEVAEPAGESAGLTIYNLEPGQQRLVAAVHRERKLVGAAVVKETDTAPMVELGPGGTVTGRAVDRNGKPLAGLTVELYFARRGVDDLYRRSPGYRPPTTETAADGTFSFDTLMPGYEFRLLFSRRKKHLGPAFDRAPKHVVAKPGDELKLGNITLEPGTPGEEE